jgi:hypothetical protein
LRRKINLPLPKRRPRKDALSKHLEGLRSNTERVLHNIQEAQRLNIGERQRNQLNDIDSSIALAQRLLETKKDPQDRALLKGNILSLKKEKEELMGGQ